MSTTDGLKALHDRLLADRPDGAEHDSGQCPLCALEVNQDITPGGSMPETFTQEDIDAATAAATGPLQQRLKELEAQVQETEVGRAVAEATEAKDAEISKLQEQLDAAQAARTAADNKLAETEQFWTDAIAAHEASVEFAARRVQRVTEATEAGVFAEDYITENADRFAAMSDEDFKARLDEWRLIAAQSGKASKVVRQPTQTALVASEAPKSASAASNLELVKDLRSQRVDPRTLIGGV